MTLRPLALLLLLSTAAHAEDEKPTLFINDLVAQGTTPEQAAAFTDAVVNSLSARKLFKIVTPRELQATLGVERQRQLLGICESDPTACAQDLGNQTKAPFMLIGTLARVGTAFQLSLQMVDTRKGQSLSRSSRISGSLDALAKLVPYAASEATGVPLPPPPSKVLPIALMTAGGISFIAGGVLGLQALSRQQVLNDQLCPTGASPAVRCTGVNLEPRQFYVDKNAELAGQKALSLGLLLGGAAVAAAGFVLWPAGDREGLSATLVPSDRGVALVGVFP